MRLLRTAAATGTEQRAASAAATVQCGQDALACQPQPPPQIIGRPSDVERLLDEAGQRAQEVEQAVEETAAVAAEEGEVAVAAEGMGGAFGYLGGLAEGGSPSAQWGRGCWNVGWRGRSRRGGNGGAGRGHRRRRSLRPRARHGLGAGGSNFKRL